MAEYIYICPKCKMVYANKVNTPNMCSDCKNDTKFSGYDSDEWYSFPREKRELLKKTLFDQELKNRIEQKEAALPNIMISSGFSFEGYRITKYSGYISGDDAVQITLDGAFGITDGQNLTDALVRLRRQALKELKEAAYDLGCNAVIGVDFDYLTLEKDIKTIIKGAEIFAPVICVTANGNAVVIEKE